jgi:hypothetical protein
MMGQGRQNYSYYVIPMEMGIQITVGEPYFELFKRATPESRPGELHPILQHSNTPLLQTRKIL